MITEKLSIKPKRGRPLGIVRQKAESLVAAAAPEGGTRTKANWVFMMMTLNAIHKADPDTQRAILGCTLESVAAGACSLPRGYKTAAVEAGRYLIATGDDAGAVVLVIAEARKAGTSWADIAAHYRRLRLGDREGNAFALTKALARTLDDYLRRFPKTTPEQARAALVNLLSLTEARTNPGEQPNE